MSEQVLLDTAEVAKIIFGGRKTQQAVQRAARTKQIPSCRVGGRFFFVESELRAWLADQMSASVNPAPTPDDKPGTIRRL